MEKDYKKIARQKYSPEFFITTSGESKKGYWKKHKELMENVEKTLEITSFNINMSTLARPNDNLKNIEEKGIRVKIIIDKTFNQQVENPVTTQAIYYGLFSNSYIENCQNIVSLMEKGLLEVRSVPNFLTHRKCILADSETGIMASANFTHTGTCSKQHNDALGFYRGKKFLSCYEWFETHWPIGKKLEISEFPVMFENMCGLAERIPAHQRWRFYARKEMEREFFAQLNTYPWCTTQNQQILNSFEQGEKILTLQDPCGWGKSRQTLALGNHLMRIKRIDNIVYFVRNCSDITRYRERCSRLGIQPPQFETYGKIKDMPRGEREERMKNLKNMTKTKCLMVIDECQKSKNPHSQNNEILREFKDATDLVILMTATGFSREEKEMTINSNTLGKYIDVSKINEDKSVICANHGTMLEYCDEDGKHTPKDGKSFWLPTDLIKTTIHYDASEEVKNLKIIEDVAKKYNFKKPKKNRPMLSEDFDQIPDPFIHLAKSNLFDLALSSSSALLYEKEDSKETCHKKIRRDLKKIIRIDKNEILEKTRKIHKIIQNEKYEYPIVWIPFVQSAIREKKELSKLGHEVLLVTGNNKAAKKKARKLFDPDKNPKKENMPDVLIITNSMSESENLQNSNTMILFDTPWGADSNIQIEGRILRKRYEKKDVHLVVLLPRDEDRAIIKEKINKFERNKNRVGKYEKLDFINKYKEGRNSLRNETFSHKGLAQSHQFIQECNKPDENYEDVPFLWLPNLYTESFTGIYFELEEIETGKKYSIYYNHKNKDFTEDKSGEIKSKAYYESKKMPVDSEKNLQDCHFTWEEKHEILELLEDYVKEEVSYVGLQFELDYRITAQIELAKFKN